MNKVVEFVNEKKNNIRKIISEEGKLSGLHIYIALPKNLPEMFGMTILFLLRKY